MTAVVFVGPTVGIARARRHLDAVYLPPVQQGDVLLALSDGPRVIAIIDGYFDTVPSVWHKEILAALAMGVHVLGSSSMGALRAAELSSFGMVGEGKVFEGFRSGRLEDDDEVAVAHGPAESGFVGLSTAMVDIRDAFEEAIATGKLEPALGTRLTAAAKRIHYRDRTFERVLLEAKAHGECAAALDELAAVLAGQGPRAKERDAVALLDRVQALIDSDPPPLRVPWALEHTVYLSALERDVARRRRRQTTPRHGLLGTTPVTGGGRRESHE